MDLSNKKDRDALKSFFKKNSIPTESNFADLIDGMLNQKDDGIAKQPNSPLSIEADSSSKKNVLSLYSNLSNDASTWSLSLNSQDTPGGPQKPGLSINDKNGKSCLFIDENNGHTELKSLNINRTSIHENGGIGIGVDSGHMGTYALSIKQNGSNPKHGIRLINANSTKSLQLWVGTGGAVIDAESSTNLHIRTGSKERITIDNDGPIKIPQLQSNSQHGVQLLNADSSKSCRLWVGTSGAFIDAESSADLSLRTDGKNRIFINSDGRTTISQETWTTPNLLNGWTNYHNTYNSAGYFKDSFGIVHLKGLVKNGQTNKAIFTLPNNYRPAKRELHAVCTHPDTIGRIDIFTNGEVRMRSGNKAWISLDGITFLAVSFVFLPPIIPIIPIR